MQMNQYFYNFNATITKGKFKINYISIYCKGDFLKIANKTNKGNHKFSRNKEKTNNREKQLL